MTAWRGKKGVSLGKKRQMPAFFMLIANEIYKVETSFARSRDAFDA